MLSRSWRTRKFYNDLRSPATAGRDEQFVATNMRVIGKLMRRQPQSIAYTMGVIGLEDLCVATRSGGVCNCISLNCFYNTLSANLISKVKTAFASFNGGVGGHLQPSFA